MEERAGHVAGSSDALVEVESVGKKFCRSLKKGMRYSASDIARDLVGLPTRSEALRPGEFWALDDVSLTLGRGECFGLVGVNGAGKSTLLKLINGIVRPDRGRVRIAGRVGALIEVGAGFHPLLTGRENIYVNGAILGMGRREVDREFDSIVAFAGLDGSVLDAPVRTYSSGMYVRLGFAVAVHTRPDVLLVDEVLSVGDIRFVGRCRDRIAELRRQGTGLLLVSHSLTLIEQTCERAMLLEGGRAVLAGSARSVTAAYRARAGVGVSTGAPPADTAAAASGEAEPPLLRFLSGSLRGERGEPASSLTCGETAALDLLVACRGTVESGHFCVWVVHEAGEQTTGVGYLEVGRDVPAFRGGELSLRFRCQFMPGDYRLGVTFSTDGQFGLVDQFEPCAFSVTPRADNPFAPSGVFELDVWAAAAAPAGDAAPAGAGRQRRGCGAGAAAVCLAEREWP